MKKALPLFLAGIPPLLIAGAWLRYHITHPLGNLLTGDASGQLLAWGRLAGLLAVLGILYQVVVIARVRKLEGAFGFDRLTRFHHIFGFGVTLLLLAHPALVTAGHALQADATYAEQVADFWQNWRGMRLAYFGLGLILAALLTSALVFVKRMRYEAWYLTHLTLYVSFALTVPHQFFCGSDITDQPAFRYGWIAAYAAVAALLAANRLARPAIHFFRHRFAVDRLVEESPGVVSVYIRGVHLERLACRPGQFVIVRFLAKGFWAEAHPFSLSQAPDGDFLRLTVKGVGDFTRRVGAIPAGTRVFLEGAFGTMTARAGDPSPALLLAGGIGITPLRALAEAFVQEGRDGLLLYGNRTERDIVFRKELDALAASSAGRFRVVHLLSGQPDWPGEKGHVDRAALERLVPDLAAREVFLCGPRGMMSGLLRALGQAGVPQSRIHCERFAL